MSRKNRAQQVMNEYYAKLGPGPYYYDNSAVATAIREIANQYQYYQCCKDEGVEDMVVDAQKLYELSYDVEAL